MSASNTGGKLFSSLSKYAARQEENFLTESLVLVLNLLLEKEGQIGLELLQDICGPETSGWFNDPRAIEISTQFTVDEGRPDIIITLGNDKLVFIEVKHDSSLGWMQLERYQAHLENSTYSNKQLVLLTRSRHSIQETSLDYDKFHHICWYEIAGWLSDAHYSDEIAGYLVNELLGFLEEKEMSMQKVSWEYIRGMPAMMDLLNMLAIAIAEADPELAVRRSMGWSWGGYYLNMEVFTGFRYIDHLTIVFENDMGNNPTFKRILELEKVHFFSLDAGEQLECLINFIRASLEDFSSNE